MTQSKTQGSKAARQWHVLGAGAMGMLFSRVLLDNNCQVTWLVRHMLETHRWASLRSPVLVESEHVLAPLRPVLLSDQKNTGEILHLLVTTKAFDVKRGIARIAHRITPNTQILLMTNGLGVREEIESLLPSATIYNGTTTAGAYRATPQRTVLTGRGDTRIGHADGSSSAPDWFADFASELINPVWSDNIQRDLLMKLAINCAINPLTAVLGCNNGELENPKNYPRFCAVCEEISTVLAASGYTDIASSVFERALAVVRSTANNRSSMLQDVRAGKKTEIDYITGYLLAMAERQQVPAPHNTRLFKEINARATPH